MKAVVQPEDLEEELLSELLILPDGRVMAHNLTIEMAKVLKLLDSGDDTMDRRIAVRPDSNASELAHSSSAGIQPDSEREAVRIAERPGKFERSAECNSAIQQIRNLRYETT